MSARDERLCLFYNVENLFDTKHDAGTSDRDFLPEGDKKWTQKRYQSKLNAIAHVLDNVSKPLPALIGLAEVENKDVINDLLNNDIFSSSNYLYIHEDGPDQRGIDVALLYDADSFKCISYKTIEIPFPWQKLIKTRHILYVHGSYQDEEIHLYINHWPSRSGGEEATESKRLQAAWILKQDVERVMADDSEARIIIMGDFNDTPEESSFIEVLNASDLSSESPLINLSLKPYHKGEGTLVYADKWEMFDQIIVSRNLFSDTGLRINMDAMEIFKPDWILKKEQSVSSPHNTYENDRYLGGYSDHLPVYITIIV